MVCSADSAFWAELRSAKVTKPKPLWKSSGEKAHVRGRLKASGQLWLRNTIQPSEDMQAVRLINYEATMSTQEREDIGTGSVRTKQVSEKDKTPLHSPVYLDLPVYRSFITSALSSGPNCSKYMRSVSSLRVHRRRRLLVALMQTFRRRALPLDVCVQERATCCCSSLRP